MKNTIERLVLRLGLTDRVVFAGHAAVEDIWASNHLLVLPSRYEGLPLVLVEAMLCGRPVVATEIAGHPDLIEEGITGFLAEAPTVSSLLKALERFWARRAEAKQFLFTEDSRAEAAQHPHSAWLRGVLRPAASFLLARP